MVAMRFDHPGAIGIRGAVSVLAAVNFDHKFQAAAGEIDNGVADWILPGEFHAQLRIAQPRPQAFFSFRRIFAQLARHRRQAFVAHRFCTPTQPSPAWERASLAQSSPVRGWAFMAD